MDPMVLPWVGYLHNALNLDWTRIDSVETFTSVLQTRIREDRDSNNVLADLKRAIIIKFLKSNVTQDLIAEIKINPQKVLGQFKHQPRMPAAVETATQQQQQPVPEEERPPPNLFSQDDPAAVAVNFEQQERQENILDARRMSQFSKSEMRALPIVNDRWFEQHADEKTTTDPMFRSDLCNQAREMIKSEMENFRPSRITRDSIEFGTGGWLGQFRDLKSQLLLDGFAPLAFLIERPRGEFGTDPMQAVREEFRKRVHKKFPLARLMQLMLSLPPHDHFAMLQAAKSVHARLHDYIQTHRLVHESAQNVKELTDKIFYSAGIIPPRNVQDVQTHQAWVTNSFQLLFNPTSIVLRCHPLVSTQQSFREMFSSNYESFGSTNLALNSYFPFPLLVRAVVLDVTRVVTDCLARRCLQPHKQLARDKGVLDSGFPDRVTAFPQEIHDRLFELTELSNREIPPSAIPVSSDELLSLLPSQLFRRTMDFWMTGWTQLSLRIEAVGVQVETATAAEIVPGTADKTISMAFTQRPVLLDGILQDLGGGFQMSRADEIFGRERFIIESLHTVSPEQLDLLLSAWREDAMYLIGMEQPMLFPTPPGSRIRALISSFVSSIEQNPHVSMQERNMLHLALLERTSTSALRNSFNLWHPDLMSFHAEQSGPRFVQFTLSKRRQTIELLLSDLKPLPQYFKDYAHSVLARFMPMGSSLKDEHAFVIRIAVNVLLRMVAIKQLVPVPPEEHVTENNFHQTAITAFQEAAFLFPSIFSQIQPAVEAEAIHFAAHMLLKRYQHQQQYFQLSQQQHFQLLQQEHENNVLASFFSGATQQQQNKRKR
jgi:hypothetical protein